MLHTDSYDWICIFSIWTGLLASLSWIHSKISRRTLCYASSCGLVSEGYPLWCLWTEQDTTSWDIICEVIRRRRTSIHTWVCNIISPIILRANIGANLRSEVHKGGVNWTIIHTKTICLIRCEIIQRTIVDTFTIQWICPVTRIRWTHSNASLSAIIFQLTISASCYAGMIISDHTISI